MDILQRILGFKQIEVSEKQKQLPASELSKFPSFWRNTISLSSRLISSNRPEVIAEFKRRSPSNLSINPTASASVVTSSYEQAGAAAVSVITDLNFFGGSCKDMAAVAPSPAAVTICIGEL